MAKNFDFFKLNFKFFENFPTLPGDHNVARAARPRRFLYKGGAKNLYHEVVEISHSNTDHPDKGDKELNDTDHPDKGDKELDYTDHPERGKQMRRKPHTPGSPTPVSRT